MPASLDECFELAMGDFIASGGKLVINRDFDLRPFPSGQVDLAVTDGGAHHECAARDHHQFRAILTVLNDRSRRLCLNR